MKKTKLWLVVSVVIAVVSVFSLAGCKTTTTETTAAATMAAETIAATTTAAETIAPPIIPGSKVYTMEEINVAVEKLIATKYNKKLKIANDWVLATHVYAATSIPTCRDIIEKAGHEFIVFDGNGDAALQANQIDDMIAMKVDLINMFPVDSKAIVPSLKKAYDAGIPVLITYSKVADDAKKYTIGYAGPDDYLHGQECAEMMNDALKGVGKVAILEGAAGTENCILRTKGFVDRVKELGSKIQIVSTQATNWDANNARNILEDLLIKNPDLNGVYTHDDTQGPALAAAVKASGIDPGQIKIIGVGGGKVGLAAVRDGLMYGETVQSAYISGLLEAVKSLEYFANGMKLGDQYDPYYNLMPLPKVTKENVQEYLPGTY